MAHKHVLLVVDDEPHVVQSVHDLVRREFRVFGANRAQEALDILGQEEVHLVMTDQRMPGLTGVEFLSQVRETHPEVVRLLFTGYADIRAVIDAINQGSVYRYITKPWDPDELLTLLRQAGDQYDLLREREQLLRHLQEKNLQLEQANEELRRSARMKEAFIRVASHELRTPLTIVLGLTELARLTPDPPAPLPNWLARIQGATERLHQLVDQLCQFLQAGRFDRPLDRHPTELIPLLEEAIEEVRPFAQQRGQDLKVDLDPELGSAEIEATKVRDSVNHLLLNAIKFSPDGGLIEVRARALPVSQPGEPSQVEIQVHDSGVGIAPGDLPHIFDPFFTGFDVSQHSSGQFEFCRRGMGMGLSLVKAFIEMHGGTVAVTSQPDQGATFTVTLPRSEPTWIEEAVSP
jgi:signal transduction histidine kinase